MDRAALDAYREAVEELTDAANRLSIDADWKRAYERVANAQTKCDELRTRPKEAPD